MDTLSIDKYQHQYINGKNVGNVAYNPHHPFLDQHFKWW